MFGYNYTIFHTKESKNRPETKIRTKNPVSIGEQIVYGDPLKQSETLVSNVVNIQHLDGRSVLYVECLSDSVS
ncbi:hypothetical protein [Enterovibrio norvegicus]|uniref:hypothetical protein n=1 Tax=Enterovibrio norvegicus TaxID=188144 RepID=UPI000C84EA0D|nr:hypothetical protein BCU62_15550 [Enterovibrio norvegicus]